MIIRKVIEEDLPGIARLYKVCFNIEMKFDRYNYWYNNEGIYTSVVAEENGIVVGHNAFVINNYLHKGQNIKVGLSAAGMVDSELVKNPGTFLKLIEATRDLFNYLDIIIAFPNKKAEPFWTRVLKFTTIHDNYYFITPDLLNSEVNRSIDFNFSRNTTFIEKRIHNHGRFHYIQHRIGDIDFIFKEFNENIELVYLSKISAKILDVLNYIFNKGYKRINIISIYGEALMQYGFVKGKHNVFVYQWQNKIFENDVFECQMIDSDVF